MKLIATLLPIIALTASAQNLDLGNKDAVVAAARAAIGPLKQYFTDPNTQGGGAWREQSGGRWVLQWHESGMYQDLFFQYALASGDGSSNGFAANNLQAASNGRDFLGISGAEAGAGGNLRGLAATTFDDIWMSWDDKCGGGIYWSRNRNPDGANPYLKSSITNVQMMDLGARLGYTDKANQIWNWMKSSGLVVDDGNGGYVILDRAYSYHAGEAITALSLMGNLEDATKLLYGLRNTFGDGQWTLQGYLWPVYKGLSYLFRATGDGAARNLIATILKANAARVLSHCTADWDCMRNFGAGAGFTLNVRDQFEAVALLTALIPVSAGVGGLGSISVKGGGAVAVTTVDAKTTTAQAPAVAATTTTVEAPIVSPTVVVSLIASTTTTTTTTAPSSSTTTTRSTTSSTSSKTTTAQTTSVVVAASNPSPTVAAAAASDDSSNGSAVNGGAIAGGVIAGLVVVVAAIAGSIFYHQRSQVSKPPTDNGFVTAA
ncbi:hypothetical protein BDR26DRAFT_872417 [Obelidium mucronatum]|nr:hypothetical protein BDR26DRAFT_872417 [Obelidium mucronatum]